MNYSVLPTENYKREAKRLIKKFPSLKGELESLSDDLMNNPEMGTLIREHVYKIRLAVKSKGKGKSGGMRVITYVHVVISQDETEIYLMSIYDKSEMESISDKILNNLIEGVEEAIANPPPPPEPPEEPETPETPPDKDEN